MAKDKDFFIENFAMLMDAKLDIVTALETLENDIKAPKLKKRVGGIKEAISKGSPVWKAFDGKKLLPDTSIALIKIGEASGRLAENLRLIALQHRKEASFKGKLQSAMMYPMVILVLTLLIGVGISWYILPRLASVFTDLDVELPLITKILIGFGALLQSYGLIILPVGTVLIGIIFYLLFLHPKTRFIGQHILFAVPVMRQVMLEVEMSRLGQVLGNLLDAGLPILDAMNSLTEATTISFYKKFYIFATEQIKYGTSFENIFKEYKHVNRLIPNFIQQIIIAGESSGQLSESLIKIGQVYEEKIELTTKNLTVILEPVLLVIIWLSVVSVALAVVLPIYSLIGGINS